MELDYSKNKIVFNRELSELDKLVLRFVKIMHRLDIKYVIISGYIAILFGRSRNTEDVDLFIEKISESKMKEWWGELEKEGFECINVSSPIEAMDYLNAHTSIRFAEKGLIRPNFEIKFPWTQYNHYSINHPVEVEWRNEKLNTSEIELQIAFKLYLGSEKDFEDAKHLYIIFKEQLNIGLLNYHVQELNVEKQAEKILWT